MSKDRKTRIKTLCELIGGKASLKLLKPMVRRPKHICRECGRAAATADRLCAPERL